MSKKTFQEMSMEQTLQSKKVVPNTDIQPRPRWQFEFEHGEIRTQVFILPNGEWVYVNHDRFAVLRRTIRPEDQQHPFAKYDTMREALVALGWNQSQPITYRNHVPPSVQDDWEDMTEDEFLDNPINYSPAPIVRIVPTIPQVVPYQHIQTRPEWQFEFEHGDIRTQVFTLPGGAWVYVNHDSAAERLHSIRPEDQQHPFAKYDTMREALVALGWNQSQPITYWNYVPPSVQWDWEDMTEDEFLDNRIHYSPEPIVRLL